MPRRVGKTRLIAKDGKIVKQCNHRMLAIGTHESFLRRGWLCVDCGDFLLNPNLEGYGACIACLNLPHGSGVNVKEQGKWNG